jgi:hypothetical protein
MTPLPNVYGRIAELDDLREFLSRRQSFLLYGPTGVGKTLLLKHLASACNEIVYCRDSSDSQTVFRAVAAELFARNNPSVLAACGTSGIQAINRKSAVSLRGIVASALREERYFLVLDQITSPSHSFAAAVKDLVSSTGAALVVAARSVHMEHVGFLQPMFAGRSSKFELRNFDAETAKAFAVHLAAEAQLGVANRDEVIHKVVEFSKGNPGAIEAMLQMAANPRYIAQQHVKLSPLYIDFRLSWGN